MLNIQDVFVIDFPSGRWGYVGRIPAVLGEEVKASTSDVMGGRAYRNEAGELVTIKFPSFPTKDEAVSFAASKGIEVKFSTPKGAA